MASDDWFSRPRPTEIDINKLLQRNPRHANCNLVIQSSSRNSDYVGLYCAEHLHWFTWINPAQTHYCETLGIPNPTGCPSCAHLQEST